MYMQEINALKLWIACTAQLKKKNHFPCYLLRLQRSRTFTVCIYMLSQFSYIDIITTILE